MAQPDYSSLGCPNCNGSLLLKFDDAVHTFHGVAVDIKECPILACPECGCSLLHAKVMGDIEENARKASEQGYTTSTAHPKFKQRKYRFCEKVDFLYDSRDNLLIPGLWRGSNNGFLTPVFFRRHVLHKYRNTPDYRVEMASDTYGTIHFPEWEQLQFGMNRNNHVIAWLGDIDKLPIGEQYYLRSENIDSSHDVASEFYDAQIDVVFTELSAEEQMFRSRAEFVRSADSLTGSKTTHLDEESIRLLTEFSPPWDQGKGTVPDAFHDLHKICVETINRKVFVQDLATRDEKPAPGWGSLKVLEFWMEKALDCADASSIVCPLFVLDDLRQLEAHLFGSQSEDALLVSARERLDIPSDCSLEDIYRKLIEELGKMYKTLAEKASDLAADDGL